MSPQVFIVSKYGVHRSYFMLLYSFEAFMKHFQLKYACQSHDLRKTFQSFFLIKFILIFS